VARLRLLHEGDQPVLNEFLGAIREKRRPKTCVVEHIKSLALTIAAVESSRRGCVVEVAEFTDFLRL